MHQPRVLVDPKPELSPKRGTGATSGAGSARGFHSRQFGPSKRILNGLMRLARHGGHLRYRYAHSRDRPACRPASRTSQRGDRHDPRVIRACTLPCSTHPSHGPSSAASRGASCTGTIRSRHDQVESRFTAHRRRAELHLAARPLVFERQALLRFSLVIGHVADERHTLAIVQPGMSQGFDLALAGASPRRVSNALVMNRPFCFFGHPGVLAPALPLPTPTPGAEPAACSGIAAGSRRGVRLPLPDRPSAP